MKKIFEEFREKLNNEIPERKIADYKQEKEILKEYNGRQLLELLQNIDDQKSEQAIIKLDTKNRIVIIANSGNAFSEKGLKSLMMAHLSSKDKTFIGNKGLGFRSLLNWAGEIYVKSENLNIEFSEENRNRLQQDKKRAILSAPEWIDENNTRCWIKNIHISNKYITYIAIHYKKESQDSIIEQIENISEELLLFINHIKEIRIIKDEEERSFSKKDWKVFTEEKGLPDDLKEEDDENEHYQIKIIIPPKNEKFNSFLFSYFPTNIKIDFPALIHTTFDLDSSRNTIVDTEKNRFIVKELAYFIIKTAENLKEKISNWKAYEFVNITHKNEVLEKFDFYKIIEEWKETAEIYPCINNKYIDIKSMSFYSKKFSNFLENHSETLSNCIKANEYFYEFKSNYIKYSSPDLILALNNISNKKLSIDERIELIENILVIKNNTSYINKNLSLLINQDKKLKDEIFFYDDIFLNLEIPDFVEINYIYPDLQNKLDKDRLDNITSVYEFDIQKNLINPIINSNKTIQVKLKALYALFKNKIKFKKPSIKLLEISDKYIRDTRILKICDEESIIENYKTLEIDKFKDIDNFLFWLGAKNFNAQEVLDKVIEENNNKKDIQKSLHSLFILKNEFNDNLDNKKIRTVKKILVLDGNNVISDVETLFPYNENCEKESIIASKDSLGLAKYSNEKIQEFLEWLNIKEFNPENIAIEKINLLRKKDLDIDKSKSILKFLFNSKEKQEIHFKPDTDDIFIFGRLSNSLFLRTKFTEKYFSESELIFNYEKLGLKKSKNTDEFLKWLRVKEATDNKIVKKIFLSKIDLYEKIKDLIFIYKKNNKIDLPDIEFKLKTTYNNILEKAKYLYLNNEKSKFCHPRQVIAKFDFEVSQEFLEWLGLSEPKREDLVTRFLELLSQENNITIKDRKEIIILLSKKYQKDDKREKNQVLFLLNNQDNIMKNSKLFQCTEVAKKHIPNDLINSNLNLDEDFLKWIGIEKPNNKKIIKTLLKKDNPNYSDIFEVWKETKKDILGESLNNSKIKIQSPKLLNRNNKETLVHDLFLKNVETPFYNDNEIVIEFKGLGLDNFDINEVENFLVWLGVNRYVKYIKIDNVNEIYKLKNISELQFDKLILLLEKENIVKTKGVLECLQNKFLNYQYWILKDYGISLINPPIEYENNSYRIKLLEEFGIKQDFDEINSLFLLQNLYKIDKKGNFAPQVYKEILGKEFNFQNETFQVFTKRQDYEDSKKLYYLDNSKQLQSIQNRYELIDLPINLNINKVIKTFGVERFPTYNYEIKNFRKINSIDFDKYFNSLKAYFLAFGSLNKNNKEKERLANELNILDIKFGTFDCFANKLKVEIENFEMIYSNNIFYIHSKDIINEFSKNLNLTNSIENILLTIDFDDNGKFRNIFRNADFGEYEYELTNKYGSNLLNDIKKLLNKKEDMYIVDTLDIQIENKVKQDNDINSVSEYVIDNQGKSKSNNSNILENEEIKNGFIDNSVLEFENIFNEMPELIKSFPKFHKTCNNFKDSLKTKYKNNHFNNNYSNLSQEQQNEFKVKAGEEAENIVKDNFPDYIQVSGYAENGDDSLGYDFEYIEDNQKHFVEVKNFSKGHFIMSENELKIAKEKGIKYHIYLVENQKIYDIGNIYQNLLNKIIESS
ncbi:sacsin N-terminal ATP-binding-like domain-containing protein [Poseidonibacter lekithochrous]|uniref:sacsin N-terminal ATP-binding-like domain-containing protein n=1 Tax=Poseidonibacter lekithochrous TaxID=1904463 RepID=UPI0008FC57D7|nr:DUF3883 domain-containing protein [Poseidonibacter lekithochrous]QKJ23297.1 DUF3883 domain-containing protein [Poseidonibacter lekithochrous]